MSMMQKIKVDQLIQQKYGKKIDKTAKKMVIKLQKAEIGRVKTARAAVQSKKEKAQTNQSFELVRFLFDYLLSRVGTVLVSIKTLTLLFIVVRYRHDKWCTLYFSVIILILLSLMYCS